MELEFLTLKFHHLISLLLPCVCSCSSVFFVASRSKKRSSPARSPTQRLFILSSDLLWVPLHLQFLQNLKIFIVFFRFIFFFYGTRVCKTRFCFLELESYRLEIYVAKLRLSNSSSIIDLEFSKFEMLVSRILPNVC